MKIVVFHREYIKLFYIGSMFLLFWIFLFANETVFYQNKRYYRIYLMTST